jgi:hypothetical protein
VSSFNRRHWLGATLGLSASLGHWPLAQAAPLPARPADLLFGGSRQRDASSSAERFGVVRALPPSAQDRESLVMADCHFFPHGWAIDPERRERAFFFEKQGPGAGVFDLRSMQMTETIAPVKQRRFYGHGVLAKQGTLLLSTESDAQGTGAIGVRDAKTLSYLGDFPSYGARPHDCHLVDDGRVLVVSNGGGTADAGPAPCVAYIDVQSQRLLHLHQMPGLDYNTGHLAPIDNNSTMVVSAPRLGLGTEMEGAVSYCDSREKWLRVMPAPAQMSPKLLGEALSVIVLAERDLVVVTHPTPGWLTFWSLQNKSFQSSLHLERVRGVALTTDRQGLWLAYGAGGMVGRMELDTLALTPAAQISQSQISGSHLLNWPLAEV